MTTLRKARELGQLEQFAKEHDAYTPGDEAAFNRALESMAGRSKAVPVASKPRRSGD